MKTLRDIVTEHPEWLDLPIAVLTRDGYYDYIEGAGNVYSDEDSEQEGQGPIVVFSPN